MPRRANLHGQKTNYNTCDIIQFDQPFSTPWDKSGRNILVLVYNEFKTAYLKGGKRFYTQEKIKIRKIKCKGTYTSQPSLYSPLLTSTGNLRAWQCRPICFLLLPHSRDEIKTQKQEVLIHLDLKKIKSRC